MYFVHVVAGLVAVAGEELRTHFPDAMIARTVDRIDERTGLIVFNTPAIPADLLALRTVEDAFAVIVEDRRIRRDRSGLAAVRVSIGTTGDFDAAVRCARQVRPQRKGKPTFRVIARLAGEHAFRRVDLQRATELGVLDRYPSWRLVEDDAQLEVWVQMVGSWLIAGVRLSDNRMRQREYRSANLPAALKPTIAAAMALLSEPRDTDVFLDPMCGSGTILIERALVARYKLLLGGDSDPAAVAATRANVGPRHKPIEIRQWNATELPLESASVDVIATNMPFGKQIGSREENRSLYPTLIKEWKRVLRPGGRMVLLTSDRDLLTRAIANQSDIPVKRELLVLVRGTPAGLFFLSRR